MTGQMQRTFRSGLVGAVALCLLSPLGGCATWLPGPAPVKGGIADTDETLKTPMRPAATPADEKLPWWDMRNILDPRSRDIERHLGV